MDLNDPHETLALLSNPAFNPTKYQVVFDHAVQMVRRQPGWWLVIEKILYQKPSWRVRTLFNSASSGENNRFTSHLVIPQSALINALLRHQKGGFSQVGHQVATVCNILNHLDPYHDVPAWTVTNVFNLICAGVRGSLAFALRYLREHSSQCHSDPKAVKLFLKTYRELTREENDAGWMQLAQVFLCPDEAAMEPYRKLLLLKIDKDPSKTDDAATAILDDDSGTMAVAKMVLQGEENEECPVLLILNSLGRFKSSREVFLALLEWALAKSNRGNNLLGNKSNTIVKVVEWYGKTGNLNHRKPDAVHIRQVSVLRSLLEEYLDSSSSFQVVQAVVRCAFWVCFEGGDPWNDPLVLKVTRVQNFSGLACILERLLESKSLMHVEQALLLAQHLLLSIQSHAQEANAIISIRNVLGTVKSAMTQAQIPPELSWSASKNLIEIRWSVRTACLPSLPSQCLLSLLPDQTEQYDAEVGCILLCLDAFGLICVLEGVDEGENISVPLLLGRWADCLLKHPALPSGIHSHLLVATSRFFRKDGQKVCSALFCRPG